MVHTEAVSPRDHWPHMAEIANAAFSGSTFSTFLRPRYIEFPNGAFYHSLQKIRVSSVTPDMVVRVALADDADPWVDVGMKGLEAENSKWLRGELVGGKWQSTELVNGQLKSKVCEGRVLGHAIWGRQWPDDPADAKLVKERCGSGTAWPVDSLWKKAERSIYKYSKKYFTLINPDPADSPDNVALVEREWLPILLGITKAATERSKHVGHIYLSSIAVDPSFHRCGIGARLMRWGLERAEIEGCPIILVATEKGFRLYEKVGFETYGVIEYTGDKVMVYWPKTFKEASDAQDYITKLVETTDGKAQDDTASNMIAEDSGT